MKWSIPLITSSVVSSQHFSIAVIQPSQYIAVTMSFLTGRHGQEVNGARHSQAYYKQKYKQLKKAVKQMVFVNAAVCDEVNKIEERVTKLKDERKYLLRKVLQCQSMSDITSQLISKQVQSRPSLPSPTGKATVKTEPIDPVARGLMQEKRIAGPTKRKRLDGSQGKPKSRSKVMVRERKKLVQPIPLDSQGGPVFPITLANLTVYSLGEVVCERSAFHDTYNLYPVGYCSTREYASINIPDASCTYTCKIIDAATHPKFEISPDDSPDVCFTGTSASVCHTALLEAINAARGCELVDTKGKGPEFFGVAHPTIQNLIQNCPGAKKCISYSWVKFEVCNPEDGELVTASESDSSISYEALKKLPLYQKNVKELQQKPQSASEALRSLLTAHR